MMGDDGWAFGQVGDAVDMTPATRNTKAMQVDESEPKISKLYGPKGEVLLTISNRPPTGFHQGSRGA